MRRGKENGKIGGKNEGIGGEEMRGLEERKWGNKRRENEGIGGKEIGRIDEERQ